MAVKSVTFSGFIIYGRTVSGKLYALAVSGGITEDQVRATLKRKEDAGLLRQTVVDVVNDLDLGADGWAPYKEKHDE